MPNNDKESPQFEPEPNTLVLEDPSLRYGFIHLPKQILYARNLSRDAKLLYAVLLGYAWQKGSCFPGYRRLCDDMQASENMVRKYMRELEAVGLLSQKRRGLGKTNIYTLRDLRTSKIEVQEPQEIEATEPAKTAGEIEEEELETERINLSKIRKAKPSKKNDEGKKSANREPTQDLGVSRSGSIKPSRSGSEFRAELNSSQQSAESDPVPRASSGMQSIAAVIAHHTVSRAPTPVLVPDDERQWVLEYIADFARELNDQAPLKSSVTRAYNLYKRSGVDFGTFAYAMNQAKTKTREQTHTIKKKAEKPTAFGSKNKMPYFFSCLEDVLGLKEHQDNPSPPQ